MQQRVAASLNRLDVQYPLEQYIAMKYIPSAFLDRELKKGSAELLILSLLEFQDRHGYEISGLIDQRSEGALSFRVGSLYPLLYRLESRGWIRGRWVEKAGQRRRRYYHLTTAGQVALGGQRRGWQKFVEAINRITEAEHAI
jgi:PadR family transcriptional regulator, regulatory protein PadR